MRKITCIGAAPNHAFLCRHLTDKLASNRVVQGTEPGESRVVGAGGATATVRIERGDVEYLIVTGMPGTGDSALLERQVADCLAARYGERDDD